MPTQRLIGNFSFAPLTLISCYQFLWGRPKKKKKSKLHKSRQLNHFIEQTSLTRSNWKKANQTKSNQIKRIRFNFSQLNLFFIFCDFFLQKRDSKKKTRNKFRHSANLL